MKKVVTAYVLTAGAALAHPGHEAALTHGDAHWLMAWDHLAVVGTASVLIALVAAGIRFSKRKARQSECGQ